MNEGYIDTQVIIEFDFWVGWKFEPTSGKTYNCKFDNYFSWLMDHMWLWCGTLNLGNRVLWFCCKVIARHWALFSIVDCCPGVDDFVAGLTDDGVGSQARPACERGRRERRPSFLSFYFFLDSFITSFLFFSSLYEWYLSSSSSLRVWDGQIALLTYFIRPSKQRKKGENSCLDGAHKS